MTAASQVEVTRRDQLRNFNLIWIMFEVYRVEVLKIISRQL